MMMKVSIITICLNPGLSVERTIRSISEQTYQSIEWIVVDGGSTDGALARFSRANGRISKIVSGPDAGIADAMNKGLAMATGDAIMYINAGDELATNNVIQRLVDLWDTKNYLWATGNVCIRSEEGQPLFIRRHLMSTPELLVDRGCRIQHSSTIILRDALYKIGAFNICFKSSMDYDLWLRLIANKFYPQILDFPIGVFYLGGRSGNILTRYAEDRRARVLNGVSTPKIEIRSFFVAYAKYHLRLLRRFKYAYLVKERLGL